MINNTNQYQSISINWLILIIDVQLMERNCVTFCLLIIHGNRLPDWYQFVTTFAALFLVSQQPGFDLISQSNSNQWPAFVWLSIDCWLIDTNQIYQLTNFINCDINLSIAFPIIDFHWLDTQGLILLNVLEDRPMGRWEKEST